MSVSLYFGLPGSGKTTMMVHNILKAQKSGRYKNIYCNLHVAIPGVTYIDNYCVGKYDLRNSLICIDEATLFADSRDHKNFGKDRTQFFLEHRHYKVDIELYTQQWNGVDLKIRVITDRVYYVYKGAFLGKWFTRCYQIPYGIIIPDPKRDSSEKLGEIVQGYCRPNAFVRLFSPWLYRPRFYRYFDSWECPDLEPLPERYQPYAPPPAPVPGPSKVELFVKNKARKILVSLLEDDFDQQDPVRDSDENDVCVQDRADELVDQMLRE